MEAPPPKGRAPVTYGLYLPKKKLSTQHTSKELGNGGAVTKGMWRLSPERLLATLGKR